MLEKCIPIKLRGAPYEAVIKHNPMCRDQLITIGPEKVRISRQGQQSPHWDLMALAIMYQIRLYKASGTVAKHFRPHFPEYIIDKESRQNTPVTDAAINQRAWRADRYNEKRRFRHLLDEARSIIRVKCGI